MKDHFVSIAIAMATFTGGSAFAGAPGHWVLDPTRCPDLVEDRIDRLESRRDEAVDHGPLDVLEDAIDRKENRRDRAVTKCPASAWVWRGPTYRASIHPPRPASVKVYYNARTRTYYRVGNKNKRIVVIRP